MASPRRRGDAAGPARRGNRRTLARLDQAAAIDPVYPHDLLAGEHIRAVTAGDMRIEPRR
ncbi:hypothetical protein [Nocardiopsis halophila]|uniref:hypothetical protein n=1 Tax=Nocardiopsis halophila TaxID=141692 RepID=UPI000345C5CC|nr:hypothetical protein [Nocardiopsis halophila]